MKFIIVGVWAVVVTLGASYGMALTRLDAPAEEGPAYEGLRYTSLPTLSVPVVQDGAVSGYIVVRLVYTADAGVLRNLAAPPDPFMSDEVFRYLYANAKTRFGELARIDMEELALTIKTNVNARMGDEVIEDLLVDGLNYIDLSDAGAAAAVNAIVGGGESTSAVRSVTPSSPQPEAQ